MSVTLLPNVEGLVSTFLQSDADMTAIVAGRVATHVPTGTAFPVVRVIQIDDEKITQRPLWVVRSTLQIDCWGNSDWDAWRTAATAQSALAERLPGVHSRGTVTSVSFGPMRNLPDIDYSPAKHRRMFTALVTAHP